MLVSRFLFFQDRSIRFHGAQNMNIRICLAGHISAPNGMAGARHPENPPRRQPSSLLPLAKKKALADKKEPKEDCRACASETRHVRRGQGVNDLRREAIWKFVVRAGRLAYLDELRLECFPEVAL